MCEYGGGSFSTLKISFSDENVTKGTTIEQVVIEMTLAQKKLFKK